MSYRQATQLAQQAHAHAAVSAATHKSGAPPRPASANVPENEVMQRLQAKVAQALLDQRNQMHAEERSRQHELELERVRGQNQLQMALALSAQAWIQPSVPTVRTLGRLAAVPKPLSEAAGGLCRTPKAIFVHHH